MDYSLTAQFDRRRILAFGKAKIEMIDIVPPGAKGKLPLALVSGWASTAAALKGNILALAAAGRRVLYVNAPHGIPTKSRPGFPAAELRKAAALLLALDERRIRRADVVAHSEGAIVVAIAAALEPRRFRKIVFVNPAGFAKKKDIGKLAHDFSADVLWSAVRRLLDEPQLTKTVLTAWLEAGKTVMADPFKSWEEVQAISVADIAGLLDELKAHGIGLTVIHAKDDRTFPVEEVCARAKSGAQCDAIVVPGTHDEFYFRPQEFAELIINSLNTP